MGVLLSLAKLSSGLLPAVEGESCTAAVSRAVGGGCCCGDRVADGKAALEGLGELPMAAALAVSDSSSCMLVRSVL